MAPTEAVMEYSAEALASVPPKELLREVPTKKMLRKASTAAGLEVSTAIEDIDHFVEELTPVEARTLDSQIRFASRNGIYYYQVPGLTRDDAQEILEDSAKSETVVVGSEITDVVHLHGCVYVICSVPEDGSQTQIVRSEATRETVIATFDPESSLLAIRAPDLKTSSGARQAVIEALSVPAGEQLSKTVLQGPFDSKTVKSVSELRFVGARRQTVVDEIVVSRDNQTARTSDLRDDPIVESLVERTDIEVRSLQADLVLSEIPSVQIDYDSSSIHVNQFVPESTLIELDRAVESAL